MTVRLSLARDAQLEPEDTAWVAVGTLRTALDTTRQIPDIERQLVTTMDAIVPDWLSLGKMLAQDSTSELAHAPSCAGNVSDLGLMLAWSRLIEGWARTPQRVLLVTEDPWLFRHFASIPGVVAHSNPAIWPSKVRFAVRGVLARLKVAATALVDALILPQNRDSYPVHRPAILVYGHPASTSDGADGYFGSLLNLVPELTRILHVDCAVSRAPLLLQDRRTASLRAWGPWWRVWQLPFAKWRPSRALSSGKNGWLVQRAAAKEGATGQGAIIRWQQMCQSRWLARAKPAVVAWPWENHGWERGFVRCARALGVRTLGYQHATVGRQELNYSPATNRDGPVSLPDLVLSTGAASNRMLLQLGHDPMRLRVGGAFRMPPSFATPYRPEGPIFVALPSDHEIATAMIHAIRPLGADGRTFMIKDHPMNPFPFEEAPGLVRTDLPLNRQSSVSAVLYSATTVGLEAVLSGLPTLQFLPSTKVALDVIPVGMAVESVTASSLSSALSCLKAPTPIDSALIFAPPDLDLWKAELSLAD